jgi:hypothetical protein
MKLIFLEEPKGELQQAIDYFQEQREGLGREFALEVGTALQKIEDHPNAWPKLSRTVRCCPTNRFSYGLVYTIRGDVVLIIAVAHLHRKPGYWRGRLSSARN